jgi:hypothetical protein
MEHLSFLYYAENNTKQSRLQFRRFEAMERCTKSLILCLVNLYELHRKQEGQLLPTLVQIRQDLSDAISSLETIETITKEGATDRKTR